MTNPDIIDQIHELIFEDRRISAKSIGEQLDISRERTGSIIHEDLDMRKLTVKWVRKCLNADQKRQRCQTSEQLLEFLRLDPNDFLSRLVTMDETWLYYYDPETKQQSMAWRRSGSPHPKNCVCKNPLEKFSPRFFGIKTASSSLSSKGPKYQRGVLLISAGAIKGHFEGNTPQEGHQRGSCSCTITPLPPGTRNPEETGLPGLPVS